MPHSRKSLDSDRTLAYLGPQGTYSEEAALSYALGVQKKIPCESLLETFMSVVDGKADEAIIPVENSVGGAVRESVDCLMNIDGISISNEVLVEIKSALIAKRPMGLGEITELRSKSEAFFLCDDFIKEHLPNIERKKYKSTARALESLTDGYRGAAAIGSPRAAGLYGLEIIRDGVQNKTDNLTRFVVVSKNGKTLPTGYDKTSFVFGLVQDAPGALLRVLEIFADRNINLTKIESRPTGARLGSYHFLVDCEGHIRDTKFQGMFEELKSLEDTTAVKHLGSYPKGDVPTEK